MTDVQAPRKPRFNHIALHLPSEALSDEGIEQILAFYGDVFGWTETPTMRETGRRLVMTAYRFGQFVFLHAAKDVTHCNPGDHFGMQVESDEEFDDMFAKCKAWQERDSRVKIIPPHDEHYGPVRVRGFYVGYLLPMMVEVQRLDFSAAGVADQ